MISNKNSAGALPVNTSFFSTKRGRGLAIFGFWTIVAVLIASLSHSRMVAIDQPSNYANWLLDSFLVWYAWAICTPFIMWLGKRFPVEGRNRLKHGALLLFVGAVFVFLQEVYQVYVSMAVHGEWMSRYKNQVIANLAWMGPWDLMVFFGIIGVGQAISYRVRWQERQRAIHQLEIQLAKAQLDVLKAQLQPHFFFNTLNAISVLIRMDRPDKAQEMLGRLSDLMRYTLSIGQRQSVALADEMEFVRGYLEIEQTRFGDRLIVIVNIDKSCMQIPVPPLMIQPIVENAIRHGLSTKTGNGKLDIAISKSNGSLSIIVEDDGVGLGVKGHESIHEGLGLGNTRSRLERLFGAEFQLLVAPRERGGTRVTLEMPTHILERES